MTTKKKPARSRPLGGPKNSQEKSLPRATRQEVPTPREAKFPIVGVGASAGGLVAFEAFFSGMPADRDPGMAFVLVQHLDPDHKSILTELIRHYTRMPVCEVVDGMRVQANCVYVIPPGCDMAFLNGSLHLLEPAAPHGFRLPIDFFFQSLAQDQHELAIGLVLSGTGSDGTLGVRAIKGEGGMVMAQTPGSAEYDGMPRSAIGTGLVDYELPPAEMAPQLMAYAAHTCGNLPKSGLIPAPKTEIALKKIFVLLRAQTGHDFSQYKPSTILRRIERRLALHQIKTIELYVRYLQQMPTEIQALFRDLLIGVTNFFRDPEAFKILEDQVIPQLFVGKSAHDTIRVWSVGCSSGEEAYSLAILLAERMDVMQQTFKVQVFATDIDSQAIDRARAGLYPASITADLSPERLARFFTLEPDGSAYRIHRGLRDLLVFSEQNVIRDPPFSKLDLISCRNLMIYLDGAVQKKLLPLFYYALNPGGFLFLGTSETVGEAGDLFATLDRQAKLYQHRKEAHGRARQALAHFLPPLMATKVTSPHALDKTAFPAKIPLRELTETALLQQVAPAAALVNAHGDILYLHGRTGTYLEPTPGETGINNILKMARAGLHRDLVMSLHKAVLAREVVRCPGLWVKTNSHFTAVNLSVLPVEVGAEVISKEPLYLVTLEEAPSLPNPVQPVLSALPVLPALSGAEGSGVAGSGAAENLAPGLSPVLLSSETAARAEALIEALKRELRDKKEYLQATHEELETSNEELKSASEEMQSINEELQSTNEELETSKEELQSVNEELTTINVELQTKVADLMRANNDMNNLLAGTGIGTVFVDVRLRILRFTPAATQIINLILSDVGRPVGHLVSNLVGYDRLLADTQAVLDTLIPKEIEVQTLTGKWYTMRILPYRTVSNVIEGVVLTFVDITEVVQTREALAKANELLRLAVVVRDSFDAITVQDLEGRTLAWNPGAVRMYGFSEAEALQMNVCERIPEGLRENALAKLHQLSLAEILEPYRSQRISKDGTVVQVWMTATALLNESGQVYAIATTERASGVKIEQGLIPLVNQK